MSQRDEEDPWVSREPRFLELRIELMRMYRRARRRPLLTFALALVAALAMCGMRYRKQQAFSASVTFRVSQIENVATATAPRPVKELREYVESVALRGSSLLDVMKKHGIYASMIEDKPIEAVSLFRENITVEVFRNYFIEDWSANKSARIVISYLAGTAEEAAALASDLGDLVVAEETRRRESTATAAAGDARLMAEFARADLVQRERRIAELEYEIEQASDARVAMLRVELDGLRKSLKPATERLMKAEATRSDLELALVLEMHDLGVRFDKVDDGIEAISRRATPKGLLTLGLVIFVLALPFSIMLVGAFDSRVYDLDDVNRLGLRGVGHVPPFRGDTVGSLAARARASGRV